MICGGWTLRGLGGGAERLGTFVGLVMLAAAVVALLPAEASAVDPSTAVGGNGSKWFSGSLLQQSGKNCAIIGGSYSENMVSAIASYGGAPNRKIVKSATATTPTS